MIQKSKHGAKKERSREEDGRDGDKEGMVSKSGARLEE